MTACIWETRAPDPALVLELVAGLALREPVARVLAGRGVADLKEAEQLLSTPASRNCPTPSC